MVTTVRKRPSHTSNINHRQKRLLYGVKSERTSLHRRSLSTDRMKPLQFHLDCIATFVF